MIVSDLNKMYIDEILTIHEIFNVSFLVENGRVVKLKYCKPAED